jgi:uncharacterized protein with FMN-binding domain
MRALWKTTFVLLVLAGTVSADHIEFRTGAKLEGRIVARDGKQVKIETTVNGRTLSRIVPLDRLSAIVVGGRREVLDATAGEPPAGSSPSGASPRAGAASGKDGGGQRTKAEIETLIQREGASPPDWLKATPLEYPKSLDLSFREPASGGWDNQKNVGQYLWDIINPNAGKWRSGVRFLYHLLDVNRGNRQVEARVMNHLGGIYYRMLQDYARAAYWWRQAGVETNDGHGNGVHLAECYWKLGSKQMALDLLGRITTKFSTIKLLSDMGETDRALAIAKSSTQGSAADWAYLYAGDACRVAGRLKESLAMYEKVLSVPATGKQKNRIERSHQRARANIEAIKVFELLDLRQVPDGVYRSNSMGYEAPVHVEVVVRDARIEDVRVTDHREKQYYSSITDTCQKIIAKQGVTGIDATSCATITSEAIINATAKALAGAGKGR